MARFCFNCGKEIDSQAKFCSHCGSKQGFIEQKNKTEQPIEQKDGLNNTTGEKTTGTFSTGTTQNNFDNIVEKIDRLNPFCITGLIVSGLSLFLNYYGIIGITGFILSILGYTQIKKANENGKILSIIGITIGAVTSAIWLISYLI